MVNKAKIVYFKEYQFFSIYLPETYKIELHHT